MTEIINDAGNAVAVVWTHREQQRDRTDFDNFTPAPDLMAHLHLLTAAPALLNALVASLYAMERMDALLLAGQLKECEKSEIVQARLAISQAMGKDQ